MSARASGGVAVRTGVMLACAVFALVAAPTQGRAEAPVPAAKAKASGGEAKGKGKGKTNKTKKAGPESPADAAQAAPKRRRLGVSPAYIVGDTNPHFINDSAPKIVPFAENSKAVTTAWAENRRDQIADAEKAARAEKSPDRWRTVLFSLHLLPEHNDSEVCFWRVLAFYRLGELERARKLREGCELPMKDSSVLNQEDARAAGTPAMQDLQQAALTQGSKDASADVAPSPTAPYTGPTPQRRD